MVCSGNSADEDQAALARLAFLPLPLMIAFGHHVDTLEYIAILIAGEGENTAFERKIFWPSLATGSAATA